MRMAKKQLGENFGREWDEDIYAPQLWDALELIKSDSQKGIRELERLSEAGSTLASMHLGNIFLKGQHGVDRDREKGYEWLEKSAREGSLEGLYGLAWHRRRDGEIDAALDNLSLAAERGFSPAFYTLGALYYKGNQATLNREKSFEYFRNGESHGHLLSAGWANRMRIAGYEGWAGRLHGLGAFVITAARIVKCVFRNPNSDRLRY